jgi:ribosomal protein S6--L-glutamate ligase
MNILILNSSERCFATQSIIKAGEKHGHKMIVLDPAYFSPLISNIEAGYDRVYDLLPKAATRITIREIDAIIPRIGNNLIYNSYVVEHLSDNLGIYSIQTASGLRAAANKFHTLQLCSRFGIKTPLTIYVKTISNIDFLIEKANGIPLILKYNYGSQGAGVMLMESRKSAVSTIEGLIKNKADFIIQEYIESRGKDIRAVVMGDRVVVAYQRTAARGDFRSNLSLGGSGELVQLSADDEITCVKASKAIGLEVSGVDLIKDIKGTTYLNEINSNFGFKGQKITGVDIGEYLLRYLENREITGKTAQPKSQNYYYEQVRSQNRSLWDNLKFFIENRRMKELFEKAKDKPINYRDLSGKMIQKKIRNIYDLYRIVFETFTIK